MLTLLTTIGPAIFGALLRVWNEGRKDALEKQKLRMAIRAQDTKILESARKSVVSSTFLQFMMMVMVFVGLGALVLIPLLARVLDVPLFVVLEFYKETGFWIFKTGRNVKELIPIEGLYLAPEFQYIIQGAVSMIFGNVVAGLGRR